MHESAIEREGRRLLGQAGFCSEKLGVRGLPDNIVFLAMQRHFFIEWKQPHGRLTPLQKRRIPAMRERGEWVAILDHFADAVPVACSVRAYVVNLGELHPLFYAPAT